MGRKEVKSPVTKAVYLDILKQRNLELEGEYSTNARIEHRCLVCGSAFLSRRAPIISGSGCPICEGRPVANTRARHTEDSFKAALREVFPALKTKRSSFVTLGKPVIAKCATHGVFTRVAGDLLKTGCLSCRKETTYASRTLDKGVWESRISEVHGDKIRLLGQYLGTTNNRRYRFKCYVCFNTWKAQLHSVCNTGTGCPHCANQKKTKAGFRVKEFKRDGVLFRVQGWEYQAIVWMLENTSVLASDILTESSSKIPVFRYKHGRRLRNYYPDLYIPSRNAIVEVKSNYTLGLTDGKRSRSEWRKNQAKAKAVIAAGYKFILMVMTKDGSRIILPKGWFAMSREAVLLDLAYRNGDRIPSNINPPRVELSCSAARRLISEISTEKNTR